jgi:hypothetical protein
MNAYSDVESFVSRFYARKDGTIPKLLITPYAYSTTFLALAQNGTATNVLNIAANGDFVLLGVRHRTQIGAAQNATTKTAPFVRMLVTDSGSNEQYTNTPVDLENYSQNGLGERMLSYPRVVAGRTTLTVVVTNYAPTAETYTSIDVMFDGVLVREFTG